MKAKKQSALSRLMKIAGKHKYFSYASCVLAAISAWVALIPFYDVWRIIKEVLEVRPDYSKATHVTSYGWQAVGFALLAMVLYIGALMCSHKAAFRVQTNMRIAMMNHIMKLPLGYVETEGTGKVSDEKLVEIIRENFDLRPSGIIKMLDLRRPIYKQTASYGHFGRNDLNLPWEKLDRVDALKMYL